MGNEYTNVIPNAGEESPDNIPANHKEISLTQSASSK